MGGTKGRDGLWSDTRRVGDGTTKALRTQRRTRKGRKRHGDIGDLWQNRHASHTPSASPAGLYEPRCPPLPSEPHAETRSSRRCSLRFLAGICRVPYSFKDLFAMRWTLLFGSALPQIISNLAMSYSSYTSSASPAAPREPPSSPKHKRSPTYPYTPASRIASNMASTFSVGVSSRIVSFVPWWYFRPEHAAGQGWDHKGTRTQRRTRNLTPCIRRGFVVNRFWMNSLLKRGQAPKRLSIGVET